MFGSRCVPINHFVSMITGADEDIMLSGQHGCAGLDTNVATA